MKEESEEIHQPTWIGQLCKDVLGRTFVLNKCISCVQVLQLAQETYHLMRINKPHDLETCQARLQSAEIRLEALICMLEENLEKQENDQKKRQQQSESNKIVNNNKISENPTISHISQSL
jgi:hypothetical protein